MAPSSSTTGVKETAMFRLLSANDFAVGRKRPVYRKTRLGCLACKVKKVKCDEEKPVCLRCRRNSRSCVYAYSSGGSSNPGHMLSSVTVVPFDASSATNGTPSHYLIGHLLTHWDEIFYIPQRPDLLSFSKSDPLLRDTLLAITASHLRHVSPGVASHKIAESFQQAAALQSHRESLQIPRSQLGQHGANMVLLSSSLLNPLAFALPIDESTNPSSSWVFSSSDDRLGWLTLQAGLRSLIVSMAPFLNGSLSLLGPIFFGSEEDGWAFRNMQRPLESVPELWRGFFELKAWAGTDCFCEAPYGLNKSGSKVKKEEPGVVFRPAVTMLALLRQLPPVRINVFKYLQFLGKIHGDVRDLLLDRDEKALWLVGYWTGLMCRFEGLWWCERRVRRDYQAIRMWLGQRRLTERPGREGVMWRAMLEEYEAAPKYVCGA